MRLNVSRGLRGMVIGSALIASGCAHLTHYNDVETISTGDGHGQDVLLIDAKQRAILPTVREVKNSNGGVVVAIRSFCAEPSPDALSALAATFGATVNVDTRGSGAVNGGLSEGAASIGLRTTSIQVLRDIMYRQCEGYASGGISTLGLETLQRRFQSTIVALLSIEQLTGAVRAPAVVISGSAAASDAKLVAELTQQTEQARAAAAEGADAAVAAKQKAADADAEATKLEASVTADKPKIEPKRKSTDEADKKAVAEFDQRASDAADKRKQADQLAKESTAAATTAQNRKEALDSINAARTAALAGGGTTSTRASAENAAATGGLNAEAANAVSKAVSDIVSNTLSLGFGREVCTSIIGQQIEGRSFDTEADTDSRDNAKEVLHSCLDLLRKDGVYADKMGLVLAAKSRVLDAAADGIKRCVGDPKCTFDLGKVASVVQSFTGIADETAHGHTPFTLVVPTSAK